MALLSLQDASIPAVVTPVAAAAGGDTMPGGTAAATWSLPIFLWVRNAHTLAQSVTVEGQPLISIPASGFAVIPVAGGIYYKAIKTITYSGVTALTVAAVRLGPEGS